MSRLHSRRCTLGAARGGGKRGHTHIHIVVLDRDGNGTSSKEHGHVHRVAGFRVLPGRSGHTHTLPGCFPFPATVSLGNVPMGPLGGASDVVMPGRPFYVTNDARAGLYFRVDPRHPMTRRQVVNAVLDWLHIRNVYYNVEMARKRGGDVDGGFVKDMADRAAMTSGLILHELVRSKGRRKGHPVYGINLSS